MKILWNSLLALAFLLPSVLLTDTDQDVLPIPSTIQTESKNPQPDADQNKKIEPTITETLSNPDSTQTQNTVSHSQNPGAIETRSDSDSTKIQQIKQTNAPSDPELKNTKIEPEVTKIGDSPGLKIQQEISDQADGHLRIVRSPYYDSYGYPSDYYYRRRYNPYPAGVGLVLVLGGGGIGRFGGGGIGRFGGGGIGRFGGGGPRFGAGGPGFGGGRIGGGGFGGGVFGGGGFGGGGFGGGGFGRG